MTGSADTLLWSGVGLLLVSLAVPWFLWGSSQVVAGLPVWIWWHAAWLCLATVVFTVFARYAWGVGIEDGGVDG